jgi:hypothetical protein
LAKQLRIDLNQRGLEGHPTTILMGFLFKLVRAVALRPLLSALKSQHSFESDGKMKPTALVAT